MPRVEVVYAEPERALRRMLDLPAGATVRSAIEASGVLGAFPDIRPERDGAAIWGRRVALDARLEEGDRVEVLRPLQADPHAARRARAAAMRRR